MILSSPPRRRALVLAAMTLAVAAVLAPASTATAAEGPAPEPRDHRLIAGVHTDAVSTFLDDGTPALASKADVAEGNGTRFAADDIRFHLADDAKVTVPAGYEFLAPAGEQVWIAPESNPGTGRLWPGFSTESVPAGAVEADRTTFTLTGVEGPGRFELFTAGGLGCVKRLWSSAGGFDSFTVGRTHMHANWAFTAAGTYRIGVQAAVVIGGREQTARATYTFVVGGLPVATPTTTALSASATGLVAGEAVSLTGTVTPAGAPGWVEFLDGGTILGHAAVQQGRATLDVPSLPLGSRQLTARFVPRVIDDFGRSTSDPVTITVTEQAGGEVFAITGMADSYQAGQQIDLRFTGITLREGDQARWLIRPAGMTTNFLATRGERYSRDATVALDGSDVKVQIRDASNTVVQETGYRRLSVSGPNPGTGEVVTVSELAPAYFNGDFVRVTAGHRPLTGGETTRWVNRTVPSGVDWRIPHETALPKEEADGHVFDTSWLNQYEWAYEIVAADGTVIGRSPALATRIDRRELQLSGIRTVYRAGDTLRASSELYPAREDVTHEWSIVDGGTFTAIPGGTAASLELPVTAGLDGTYLYLTTTDARTGHYIAGAQQQLRVTDAAPGEQLLFLDSLSGHYHQGGAVSLHASADPVAGDSDTYRWLWKRPDQAGFVVMDGITTAKHEVRAEQALDGTLVKAELYSAAGTLLATSEPATIHVDDHGAAPQQKVTVASERRDGSVTLSASVAPASMLSRWEWYVDGQLVTGENDARLTLPATDGATVVARLTFDDGRAYVESEPVTLEAPLALAVSGMASSYASGEAVTLQAVQTPQGPLDAYQWFSRKPGADDYTAIDGETGASYRFTASESLDGTRYLVKLSDGSAVVATSAPVMLAVTSGPAGGDAAKTVTATISETEGALVISVDAADRDVTLPAAALNAAGDRWESSGALKPVTVTDTRSSQPGWTASGQMAGGFRSASGESFSGDHLGWTPVVADGGGSGVVAGPRDTSLGDGAVLASGSGRGTARLDAQLTLSVPTSTEAGVYTGVLTLTAI
ncbi:choice-of-anchor M domain-containing protein [Actinoplanes sp. NPDC023714]|uniref:choice-of-anchor M domain-containing protein n=1 Tax=Actinoplanes sp. NPDC023714 TaxID=3154322 RepID=UPI00340DA351